MVGIDSTVEHELLCLGYLCRNRLEFEELGAEICCEECVTMILEFIHVTTFNRPAMSLPEEGKLLSEALSTVKIQVQQMRRYLVCRIKFKVKLLISFRNSTSSWTL